MTFRFFDIAVALTVAIVLPMSLLGLGSRSLEIPILSMALLYLVARVLRLIWVSTSLSLLLGTKSIGGFVEWSVVGHRRLVGLVVAEYGSRTPSRVFGIGLTIDLVLLRNPNWEAHQHYSKELEKTSSSSHMKKGK